MVHEKLSLSNQLSERRTELATDRTLMAASRTLMAWVRTGISQISFGFSLYKILDQFLAEGKLANSHRVVTPSMMGTLLLCLGVLAIIFGIVEYEETCLKMGAKHKWQPLLMAGLVGLIGVALLVAVFFNL